VLKEKEKHKKWKMQFKQFNLRWEKPLKVGATVAAAAARTVTEFCFRGRRRKSEQKIEPSRKLNGRN